MRIVFIGTVRFSAHCLREVLRRNGQVVGVLTRVPDSARFNADYADLGAICKPSGIPCYEIKNINDENAVSLIRSLKPDVIFVFGWSQIVKDPILEIPRLGCIGVHPALLPKNRGRHPLIWALVEGLTESGLTFFYLDEGADSGDILWQRPFPITLQDDAGTLYGKIELLANDAISNFLPQLRQGIAPRVPQDHMKASYWRKRSEKDGEIDWSQPSIVSYNLVRALTRPYVGAHTYAEGDKILIWRVGLPEGSLPANANAIASGTVFHRDETAYDVRTGDGYLRILQFERQSNKPMCLDMRLGTRS